MRTPDDEHIDTLQRIAGAPGADEHRAATERVVSAARAVDALHYSGNRVPMEMRKRLELYAELRAALAALDALSTR